MGQIGNKIKNELVMVDWANNMKPIQPEDAKITNNLEALKTSLKKHSFTFPFAVWKSGNKYFTIDGHTRVKALQELQKEGIEVPDRLPAFEIIAKDRKEAVQVLVEVFNQKHNPFVEEVLAEWLESEEVEVEDLGAVNIENVNNTDEQDKKEEDGSRYTRKVEAPIYEPSKFTPPHIKDTYDTKEYYEHLKRVEQASVPDDVKEMLKMTATRFIKFDYTAIAEYYAHSGKETQECFEDQALVIIDFDKAIEKGYVDISQSIIDEFEKGR